MKAKKSKSQPPPSESELLAFVEDLKHQWMSTIDSLVDPLMIVRKDYSITKANLAMAKMANKDIRHIIGEKCYSVFANRSKPCDGCKMLNAAKDQKPKDFSLEEAKDGFHFEVTSQPIMDRKGKLAGVVQVYRDRTEKKKLQEQLLQSEKLASIGLLAGGFAHEINNPLGGILVFAQMLLRELPTESAHRTDVEEILNAAQRCKGIVENLLDFARSKPAQKTTEDLQDVNVIEAAQSALRFAKVSMPKHLITIEELWHATDVKIKADRNKLIQLFLNLFQNAVQAMPDGGNLTLRSSPATDAPQHQVVIEVQDTGVGIQDKYLKTIFDPFFTTKEPGEGTGLGLAICYGIVRDIGGDIKVTSKLNVGTTFTIAFPTKGTKKLKKSA